MTGVMGFVRRAEFSGEVRLRGQLRPCHACLTFCPTDHVASESGGWSLLYCSLTDMIGENMDGSHSD